MLGLCRIPLRNAPALGNRRLIAVSATAGAACLALLVGHAAQPNAQIAAANATDAAFAASGGPTARAEIACEEQHWPYVDRRCLSGTDAMHPSRMVRRVTADRVLHEVPGSASASAEAVAEMDADDSQAAIRRAASAGRTEQSFDAPATAGPVRATALEDRAPRKVARTKRVRVVVMHDPAWSGSRRTDRSGDMRSPPASAYAASAANGGSAILSRRVILIQRERAAPPAYDPGAYAYSPANRGQ